MVTIEVITRVRAPIARTFEAFSDHEAFSDIPGLTCQLIEEGADERNGVGALRRVGGSGVGALERVTEFDRPHSYAYQVVGGVPLRHDGGRLVFREVGEETEVEWTTIVGSGLPLVGGAIDRALITPIVRSALNRLARSARRRAECV